MADATYSNLAAGMLWMARHALKRALKGASSELLQSSLPEGPFMSDRACLRLIEAALPIREIVAENKLDNICKGERPRLRIIQDPISKLSPEILYRQIQYVVRKDDWTQEGEEVEAPCKTEEQGT